MTLQHFGFLMQYIGGMEKNWIFSHMIERHNLKITFHSDWSDWEEVHLYAKHLINKKN